MGRSSRLGDKESSLTKGMNRRTPLPYQDRGRDAHYWTPPALNPYVRLSRIRFPPWVFNGEPLTGPGVKDARFGEEVVSQLLGPCPCGV